MTDVFDAPQKRGFRVGFQITVIDDDGEQLSCTEHEMYGMDNSAADQLADDLFGVLRNRVKEYSEIKSGKWREWPIKSSKRD